MVQVDAESLERVSGVAIGLIRALAETQEEQGGEVEVG